jgi:hypothetical protein
MTVLRQVLQYFVQIWGFVIFGLNVKICGFAICGWHTLDIFGFAVLEFADFIKKVCLSTFANFLSFT